MVARPSAVVTLEIADRTIDVVPLHLPSPEWSSVRRTPVATLVGQAAARREAATVAAAATSGSSALVVAGDLNSTPLGDPWRALRAAGLTDAHEAAGVGAGFTRFLGPFGFRIDAIFTGGAVRPTRTWVGPADGSDHHPVLTDVVLSGPESESGCPAGDPLR